MISPRKICIVSNGPLSQNPRVVKEADALAGAGHAVTVIFGQDQAWTFPLDHAIAQRSRWRARSFQTTTARNRRGQGLRFYLRARKKLFALLSRLTMRFTVAERALGLFIPELTRLAVEERADLYIGHNPAGLVAAAWAARRIGARYAFDAEDFHTGQYPDAESATIERRWVAWLEHKYLRGCCHVTAASPGIARALQRQYGIPPPVCVLNVFPWADRRGLDGNRMDRAGQSHAVTLYWFSQIVSLDRGLQEVIEAMGRVRVDVALHIRGAPGAGAVETLRRIAEHNGVASRLFFHEPVPPEQLLSRSAEHEIGLCLEQADTLNHDLAISNKLFIYLLAGNALIATRTQGQSEILQPETEAAFLYPPGDIDALARIMSRLATDPPLLARARQAALHAAKTRWNWEMEQAKLLKAISEQWVADLKTLPNSR